MSTPLDHARELDVGDALARYRAQFHIPRHDGGPCAYFCGNSLGLQPRATRDHVNAMLDDWARLGVDGHFDGPNPWYPYHERFRAPAAHLAGAHQHEVVVMNSLTTNLHLLMVSFYRPTRERYRIVIEHGAFPSDRYAVRSQAAFHGFDPDDAVVELAPEPGEDLLDEGAVEAWLQRNGDDVALLLFGGVNYHTGQRFDLARLTAAAHAAGAIAGFDLAHAAGNVPLDLHASGADFAAWCSYKYLNAGPGGVGFAFVHDRHASAPELPRFAGWWGNDPATRFAMPDAFAPVRGADGWQLSNAPVIAMAALDASMAIFSDATLPSLRAKSLQMSAWLIEAIDAMASDRVTLLTPRDEARRGCQLSLRIHGDVRALQQALQADGIICDVRVPDVLRLATVPLYNTFEEIAFFAERLEHHLGATL